MAKDDVCKCGHNIQEHNMNDICFVEDCSCEGFDPAGEDYDQNLDCDHENEG